MPLLLVLLAVPVCVGALTVLSLMATYAWATGDVPATRDVVGGAVFAVLALVVVGLSARSVWRVRSQPGWRVYGALLVTLSIAGVLAGLAFTQSVIAEAEREVTAQATEACGRFDMASATCPEIARRCVYAVRRDPPDVTRGMPAAPTGPGVPRAPREAAIHACIQRGGP